jgi:intein/homing endonuclease
MMKRSRYNYRVSINKKINWREALDIDYVDEAVMFIDPSVMDPEERTQFINGVFLDYKRIKKDASKDKSMRAYYQKYSKLLGVLVKTYGH